MDQSSQNEVGQSSTSSPPSPSLPPRIKSRTDPLLVVCGCFSFVTATASLLCVLVNALSAYQSFKNAKDVSNDRYLIIYYLYSFVTTR